MDTELPSSFFSILQFKNLTNDLVKRQQNSIPPEQAAFITKVLPLPVVQLSCSNLSPLLQTLDALEEAAGQVFHCL